MKFSHMLLGLWFGWDVGNLIMPTSKGKLVVSVILGAISLIIYFAEVARSRKQSLY